MTQVDRHVLIDATARFQSKSETAVFDTGINERNVINETLAVQPLVFRDFIGSINKDAREILDSAGLERMPAGLARIVEDDEGFEGVGMRPNPDFGVYYFQDNTTLLRPRLYASQSAIARMHRTIDPLFADKPSTEQAQFQLETAVSIVGWMALGSWSVQKLDPRLEEQTLPDADTLKVIGSLSGITAEAIAEEPGLMAVAMSILEYRMSGAMAYAGLTRYVHRHVESTDPNLLPQLTEVAIFQKILGNMYRIQASEDPSKIKATDFSLANPLSRAEVHQTINILAATD